MRLRTTLFGLLLVLSLVLSGIVYAGFALHKDDIVEQERDALDATSRSVATDIDSRLTERRDTVYLEAGTPTMAAHGSAGQSAALERLVQRTAFGGASVVAENGTMVAIYAGNLDESRRRGLVGSDFGHRLYVQAALNGSVYVGDPIAAESGNDIVTISAPIERGGQIVGTLNAALHIRESGFFQPSQRLLGPRQDLLVRFDSPVDDFGTHPRDDSMADTAVVDESGWSVTVSQPQAAVDDQLWSATLFQAGAVLVALLSIGLVGVWVSRTTVGHLEGLIDGLTDLESGDYGTRLDLGVTDEWSQISSQFNALAETLRQRESQLRVLNRVLRHNLRNDMSVIIAHSDTILAEDPDEATGEKVRTIRRTANNLMQTSDHARSIYEELLSGAEQERRSVDLVRVATEAVERIRAEFPETTVETGFPESAPVRGSASLSIVVEELARNALLHSDQPTADRRVTITIEHRQDDGEVCLLVRDNGPGLPEHEAALLTGEREQTDIEHGSGLGLWVVNWLVEALDGEVTTHNGHRRGTVVDVRLPADSAGDATPD